MSGRKKQSEIDALVDSQLPTPFAYLTCAQLHSGKRRTLEIRKIVSHDRTHPPRYLL